MPLIFCISDVHPIYRNKRNLVEHLAEPAISLLIHVYKSLYNSWINALLEGKALLLLWKFQMKANSPRGFEDSSLDNEMHVY